MIIKKRGIDNITNQEMVSFQLDNSGGHLFSVLSELYSKPEESTLRELATNCTDAHIMSNNQDRPFIIKLPNKEKNLFNFSVRDFGPGLNHDQVLSIYRVYGKSTKTNSDTQTGCLGLGSKSPFSISSTFYVKSFKDGLCSQYTCSMGNDGIPQITDTPITFETFEENGLEVTVPIYKEMDWDGMLKRTLKYFKVKPLVYIQNGTLEEDSLININWNENAEVSFITPTIAINSKFINIAALVDQLSKYDAALKVPNEVIQLQIYYPLDQNIVMDTIKRFNKVYSDEDNNIIPKFKISDEVIKVIGYLFKIGFQIHAAPSSIAFAPSRETIKYNELTLIYIVKELIKAAKILLKMATNKLAKITTYEDCFDLIFLDNISIKNLLTFFPVSYNSPVIENAKKLFQKEYPSGIYHGRSSSSPFDKGLIFSNRRNFGTSIVALNHFKNSLFCYGSPREINFVNLWNTTRLNFKTKDDVLAFNFITPFTSLFIKTMYRKLIFIEADFIYKELVNILKYIFIETNDKEFINTPNIYKGFVFLLDNVSFSGLDLETLAEFRKEKLEKMLEKIEIIKPIDLFDLIDKQLYSRNTDRSIRFKTFYNYIEALDDCIPSNNVKVALGLDKVFLPNALTEIEKIPVGNIIHPNLMEECSRVFLRLLRGKDKFKKNFDTALQSCRIDLTKLVPKLIDCAGDVENPMPLDTFYKEKTSNKKTFLAQIIMLYYFELYPKEVENQIAYNPDKLGLVKEWLENLNIPKKYTTKVQELEEYKKHRNTTARISLASVEKIGSPLYYYDFEITEELIDTFKNIAFELLEAIKLSFEAISELVLSNKSKTEKYNFEYQNRIVVLRDYYFNKYRIKTQIMVLNEGDIYTRYNKILGLNLSLNNLFRQLISSDTLSNQFEREFSLIFSSLKAYSEKIRKQIFTSNIISEKVAASPVCLYLDDNIYLSVIDTVMKKQSTKDMSQLKENFILTDDLNLMLPTATYTKFFDKLFAENKICDVSEFKINYGKDFIYGNEVIDKVLDLKTLQKFGNDSKSKFIRKTFVDKMSYNEIIGLVSNFYPDIIFVKALKFPPKYMKERINIISLLVKFSFHPAIYELRRLKEYLSSTHRPNNLLLPDFFSENIFKHSKLYEENKLDRVREFLDFLNAKDREKLYSDSFDIIAPLCDKIQDTYFELLRDSLVVHEGGAKYMAMFDRDQAIIKMFPNYVKNGLTLEDIKEYTQSPFPKSKVTISSRLDENVFSNIATLNTFTTGYLGFLYDSPLETEELVNEKNALIEKYKTRLFIQKIDKLITFEKGNGKFKELIIDLEKTLKSSVRLRSINITDVKSRISNYLKPRRHKDEVIAFSDFNDLRVKLNRSKRLKILHSKINKRSLNAFKSSKG